MNTSEIENVLQHAPRPKPSAGLKEQLIAQIPPAPSRQSGPLPATNRAGGSWLARWWPALAPAAVSLACAAWITRQQSEIRSLQDALQPRVQAVQSSEPAKPSPTADSTGAAASSAEQDEIARLKKLVSQLSADVSRLERMQADNQKLRAQLATASASSFTTDEMKAMEEARQKAMSIQCINNLKQLGLAVKVWALDNQDMTPAQLLEMTNEMATPKILVCPADTGHQAAADWSSFSSANCSYEYLSPSTRDGAEPNRIAFRCPIHGHIGLSDGSVMGSVAKTHPERIVQRDGKLFLLQREDPPAGGEAPPAGNPPAQ